MFFWIVAAALTFGVCLALLAPLARRSDDAPDKTAHEIEVYKDQLREIDRDKGRGLIDISEAELARAEIGRKIIRLSEAGDAGTARRAARPVALWVGSISILSLPFVSLGLYAATGSPDYPGQPLQARLDRAPSQSSIPELIAQAEAHLAANPDDARGWDVIAPIYLRLGRHDDAADAYANAIRLDEPTLVRLVGQGEALVAGANGVVTGNARALFSQALELEPGEPRSRYFLALGSAQAGEEAQAVGLWQDMLTDLPSDSPWRGVVLSAIEQISARAEPDSAQMDMIEGMVSGLAARLEASPTDVDGWQRLIQSYMVLERPREAQDALDRAREALGPTSPEAGHLVAYGLSLGLEAGE